MIIRIFVLQIHSDIESGLGIKCANLYKTQSYALYDW